MYLLLEGIDQGPCPKPQFAYCCWDERMMSTEPDCFDIGTRYGVGRQSWRSWLGTLVHSRGSGSGSLDSAGGSLDSAGFPLF
ncbi:unnamed protein product [Larinioides sclopetarius]|uniref:Uncharacterized protein n=1 Tax=Larinioides sclopetarius TaxID=280406 RepID=A0AAV2AQW4_9ARAC